MKNLAWKMNPSKYFTLLVYFSRFSFFYLKCRKWCALKVNTKVADFVKFSLSSYFGKSIASSKTEN